MEKPYIFQVVGYKNSGKTTLICGLVKILKSHGFRVGTIKHDSHDFEMDRPGTDTWNHREAGADMIAISSPHRTAIMENRPAALNELLERMRELDVILVEGFKKEPYPKIVLIKESGHLDLLEELSGIIAVGTWNSCKVEGFPVLDVNDTERIAHLILSHLNKGKEK